MGKRRYPKMTPEQEFALRAATNVQRASDGSYFSYARSRRELDAAVTAARDADCDVAIFVNGLNAETLATCAEEICNIVINQGTTVRFRHRDRVLRLSEDRDVPAAVEGEI